MKSLLIIDGVVDDALRGSFLSDSGGMTSWTITTKNVDQTLLPALARHQALFAAMAGIVVRTDNLGGFASSRIMLTTVNAIAFSRNIPIATRTAETDVAHTRVLMKRLSGQGFAGIVLPTYDHPAHIRKSKKKMKFTIR